MTPRYPKPKVGQKIVVKPLSGDSPHLEQTVSRVGRKFFYVAHTYIGVRGFTEEIQFDIGDWETSWSSPLYWGAHPSVHEMELHLEREKERSQRDNLWRELGYHSLMAGLSLSQLQRIQAILQEPKE